MKKKKNLKIAIVFLIVFGSVFACFADTNSTNKYDYNIGDLVLTDGTIVPYSENCKFTKSQKAKAVAVIIKAGNKGEALGVGLKQPSSLQWAFFMRPGYNTNFEAIQCTPQKDGANSWGVWDESKTWAGDVEGFDNWKQIYEYFESPDQAENRSEGQDISNYPAFEYVQNYAKDAAKNLKGSKYENDWFLPSIAELIEVYKNKAVVNNVLMGLDKKNKPMNEGSYWSSSQYCSSNSNAVILNFTTGAISNFGGDLKHYASNVCCVHKF